MDGFVYSQPVRVVFGRGSKERLPEICAEYGYTRGVLFCEQRFIDDGTAAALVASCGGLRCIFKDFSPNPQLSEVEKAAAVLRDNQADFAVALGGGSTIDLAKFACCFARADGDVKDYFYKRRSFTPERVPLIAMPTTAGTGSEVTCVSVCNDGAVKAPLNHTGFFPICAIVDSTLTLSAPPFLTAATGLDALSHALEGFWSKGHQPICDALAEKSVALLLGNLLSAVQNGADEAARDAVSLGALLAGLAFALPKTAGVHACSYPLSQNYHLCHGEACALTLEAFLRENASVDGRIGEMLGRIGYSVEGAVEIVRRVKQLAGLKQSLATTDKAEIKQLALQCLAHQLMQNNPRSFSAEQFEEFLINIGREGL